MAREYKVSPTSGGAFICNINLIKALRSCNPHGCHFREKVSGSCLLYYMVEEFFTLENNS